jgi:predicted nuclease of predicted toxin-antitoxin system
MRFLANENFPLPSVRVLSSSGVDIISISEVSPGITDEQVLALAVKESRIILTFDRDYGELVFRRGMPCPPGIIYLRMTPASPSEPARVLESFFSNHKESVMGNFIVLTEENFRKRPLPLASD